MGLRRLSGVERVKAEMGGPRVRVDVTLRPGAWIEPEQLFRQIALTGYKARPDDVSLTLRGRVTRSPDGLLLTVGDVTPGPQRFLLAPADDKARREMEKFGAEPGETEVEARWRPVAPRNPPPALLSVTRARRT